MPSNTRLLRALLLRQFWSHTKRWIRLTLVHALYFSGALSVLKYRRLRGCAVVLMYHRVLTNEERLASFSSDGIRVSPQTFERHLRFLRRHFTVLSPESFVQRLRSGEPFPDASCLITFDDGWHDNLTNALPALQRHNVPAVVFLPTDFIGSDRCFWQETMARQLWQLRELYRTDSPPASVIEAVEVHRLASIFIGNDATAKQAIHDFVRNHKGRDDSEIQQMMAQFRAAFGGRLQKAPHPDRFLGWEDVKHMAEAGVTFGSHAVSHRILTRLPSDQALNELLVSQKEITAKANIKVSLLAYPNGDHNAETIEAARRAGYEAAFTTQAGATAPGSDPLAVPRVNIHERATRTTAGFYATLLGLM